MCKGVCYTVVSGGYIVFETVDGMITHDVSCCPTLGTAAWGGPECDANIPPGGQTKLCVLARSMHKMVFRKGGKGDAL